jgi:hypothetical protein
MSRQNVRELIGGVIAVISIGGLVVIAVIQVLHNQPFAEPSALAAVAGAGVAVYLSNAGNNATAEKMTDGFLTAVTSATATHPRTIRAADLATTPSAETVPPPTFPTPNAG